MLDFIPVETASFTATGKSKREKGVRNALWKPAFVWGDHDFQRDRPQCEFMALRMVSTSQQGGVYVSLEHTAGGLTRHHCA
jgi:hypothetical protein